jgi:hypothetical protein
MHVEGNNSADFDNQYIENIHFLEVKAMPNNINGIVHTQNHTIEKNRIAIDTIQFISINKCWCAVARRPQIRVGHLITLKGTWYKG